jgi:hypothetical protein
LHARKDFGIFYGMSLSIEVDGIRKMLGIATDEQNKKFIRQILNNSEHFKMLVSYVRHYADNGNRQMP